MFFDRCLAAILVSPWTTSARRHYKSPLQELQGEWVQVLGAVISGILCDGLVGQALAVIGWW